MQINRLKLPLGLTKKKFMGGFMLKKTTHCTPVELLGRIDRLVEKAGSDKEDAFEKIEELLQEWKHS